MVAELANKLLEYSNLGYEFVIKKSKDNITILVSRNNTMISFSSTKTDDKSLDELLEKVISTVEKELSIN